MKLNVLVISVGNLTTGGTGKTPLTLWIADMLISSGKKPGIISRGYGRKSGESIVICDGQRMLSSIEESGDELAMISEALISKGYHNFVTAAGADRVRTAEMIISKHNPDVLILDDAFQHRRIQRDLDLLLINSNEALDDRLSHTFTIPAGNLRESKAGIRRADIVILNFKSADIRPVPFAQNFGKELITMSYISEYFVDTENTILHNIDAQVIAFSGLADNDSFILSLRSLGVIIKDAISFRDHHDYSESDMNMLTRNFSGSEIFITTEKDFVKARNLKCFKSDYRLAYLANRIELNNSELLKSKIFNLFK